MDIEQNLLLGVLAQQAGMMTPEQLMSACRDWSGRKQTPLGDVLVERGTLRVQDRDRAEQLLSEQLTKYDGDVRVAFAKSLDAPGQMLALIDDEAIRKAILSGPLASSEYARATIIADLPASAQMESIESELFDPSEPNTYVLKRTLDAGPRYTRKSLHASGGMGSVWLARDSQIGRDVALKELRVENQASRSIPARFLREARITGQLEHPGVVPVYELGCDPATGQPFYTMRFFRGSTLSQASTAFRDHRSAGTEDPMELVTLLGAFVSVCNTIAYAHSHGIVHRDLKGENVVLGDFGEVIVLDWGLAKRLNSDDDDDSTDGEFELKGTATKTVMGQVMGTPAYMAPEQAQGRLDQVGPWTDIFGLGAILYEILTGGPPFAGTNTVEVIQRASRTEIIPPRAHWAEVPPALEAACLKAMAESPADRYASAAELAREIQGWQDRQRRLAEDELRQAGVRLMEQQAALVALTRSDVFAAPKLTDTFHRMVEVSARTLNIERVSVWRYTADRRAIYCHMLYELGSGKFSSGLELRADSYPNYFQALDTSEVIAAHDACEDSRTREFAPNYLRPLGIGAILDAPIHLNGQMEGVVCHEHVGGPRKWLPDEQLFAIAIANLVSQAITQWERPMAQ
ncbi:MAG: protein kinase [Planctomycetaceae bacterium]